jgi:release factor glutamine methyltransferase
MAETLAAAGVEDAHRDARLLTAHALGLPAQAVLVDGGRVLDTAQWQAVQDIAARRARREPVSRILGSRGFWTLELGLNADTLDPRPDTETLIDAALALIPDRQAPLRVVDFGTGSGCILLSLLAEFPHAQGLGVDIAPQAVEMARQNASTNGLAARAQFTVGHWAQGLSGPFDLIVSNPPYIAEAEMATLEPEVTAYDPLRALVSGPSGLECYQALIPQLPAIAAPGAWVLLEVGHTQAQQVGELLVGQGFVLFPPRADLGGLLRCVIAQWPA